MHAGERCRLPRGVPLSLHEVEGWRPVGERELMLDLLGEGVCRKVRTECAGEKLSVQSGIHWSPRSPRQVGGGEGGAGPGGVLCSSGLVTPSKSRARGLIGDVSRFDSLGFLDVLLGVQVWCWRRPCGVPFIGYRGLLTLP